MRLTGTATGRRRAAAAAASLAIVGTMIWLAVLLGRPPTRPVPGARITAASCEAQGTKAPRPGGASLRLGIHANLRSERGRALCGQAALAASSGASLVREDLEWSVIEPRPGVLHFGAYDRMFEVAASYGLTVLPLLDSTPGWAGPDQHALPRDPAAYARFASVVVARYGPGGTFWRGHPGLAAQAPVYFELWNEPYQPGSGGDRPDPGAYARLVRTAVPSARAANNGARFLLEGETTWTARDGTHGEWMRALYAAVPDLGRYFDAVAVHPYSLNPPRALVSGDRRQSRRLEEIHRILVAHGDGAAHLWATEIGWPTCDEGEVCVGEATQAADLDEFLHLARTRWRRYVDSVIVYTLRDYAPGKEGSFGLLRRDGSPKPAWQVLRRATHDASA